MESEKVDDSEPIARVWIEPRVRALVNNSDGLSQGLTVFRNGPGTVNGQTGIPFIELRGGYRLVGPAEVAVLKACAEARVYKREDGRGYILDLTDAKPIAQTIQDWRTGARRGAQPEPT